MLNHGHFSSSYAISNINLQWINNNLLTEMDSNLAIPLIVKHLGCFTFFTITNNPKVKILTHNNFSDFRLFS